MVKEFTTRFEEEESTIKERQLGRISDEWRKEEGDFIHDAVSPTPLEVKQLQINQDTILKNSFPQYAEGDDMDAHLESLGLSRELATANQRKLSITAEAGVEIPAGYTASVVILDDNGNPLEFTTDEVTHFDTAGTQEVAVTCNQTGTQTNVPDGTEFILLPPIPGIKTITDLGTTVAARDTETDAEAWQRYLFKASNEDTGGNKNDYIRWTEERDGVGKAKCIPRWNGNGTVKMVIVGNDYKPASSTVVTDTQTYLDPNSEGLGEGRAPMGAAVTVEAAAQLTIDVSATIVLENGYDLATVQDSFETALADYLKSLVFYTHQATGKNYPVAYNQVGAKLITTAGVMNYSDLLVNAGTSDIPVEDTEAPVIGQVNLT